MWNIFYGNKFHIDGCRTTTVLTKKKLPTLSLHKVWGEYPTPTDSREVFGDTGL